MNRRVALLPGPVAARLHAISRGQRAIRQMLEVPPKLEPPVAQGGDPSCTHHIAPGADRCSFCGARR